MTVRYSSVRYSSSSDLFNGFCAILISVRMYISVYIASELNPCYLGYIAIHSEALYKRYKRYKRCFYLRSSGYVLRGYQINDYLVQGKFTRILENKNVENKIRVSIKEFDIGKRVSYVFYSIVNRLCSTLIVVICL